MKSLRKVATRGSDARPRLKAAAAACLAMVCLAQAHAFDLSQGLAAAREHDPQYRAAVHERDASREARVQGRAGLLPELSLSGSSSRNHLDRVQPYVDSRGREQVDESSRSYEANSLVLQLRQPLYNRDALALKRRGEAQSLMGERVFDVRGSELILRLAEAYAQVLLARERLQLAQAQVETFTEGAQSAQRLFERGEGTRTDVLENQASLEMAQAQRIEAANAHDEALALLRAIVGPGVPVADIRGPAVQGYRFEPLVPGRLDDWYALAPEFNSEVAARRHEVEMARQDLARADAGHHPRVDAFASLSRSRSDSINTIGQRNEQASVGVQVQVPLYQGGRVNSLQRQNLALLSQAEARLDDTLQSVNLKLQTQYQALFSGARRVLALQQALRSATEQVTATKMSVKGGARVQLDVLRAQQQLTQVAQELAKARFDHALAWLRLRSFGGQLGEGDLADVQRKLESGVLVTPGESVFAAR